MATLNERSCTQTYMRIRENKTFSVIANLGILYNSFGQAPAFLFFFCITNLYVSSLLTPEKVVFSILAQLLLIRFLFLSLLFPHNTYGTLFCITLNVFVVFYTFRAFTQNSMNIFCAYHHQPHFHD